MTSSSSVNLTSAGVYGAHSVDSSNTQSRISEDSSSTKGPGENLRPPSTLKKWMQAPAKLLSQVKHKKSPKETQVPADVSHPSRSGTESTLDSSASSMDSEQLTTKKEELKKQQNRYLDLRRDLPADTAPEILSKIDLALDKYYDATGETESEFITRQLEILSGLNDTLSQEIDRRDKVDKEEARGKIQQEEDWFSGIAPFDMSSLHVDQEKNRPNDAACSEAEAASLYRPTAETPEEPNKEEVPEQMPDEEIWYSDVDSINTATSSVYGPTEEAPELEALETLRRQIGNFNPE